MADEGTSTEPLTDHNEHNDSPVNLDNSPHTQIQQHTLQNHHEQEQHLDDDDQQEEDKTRTDSEAKDMERRVKEMEEEVAKIEALQQQQIKPSVINGPEVDSRSIYVGNVDYSVTPAELQTFFQSCGPINRITIPCSASGQPKGFAYVEFGDTECVANAMLLNESELKARQLKVCPNLFIKPKWSDITETDELSWVWWKGITNSEIIGLFVQRRRRRRYGPRFRTRRRRTYRPY